MFNTMFGCLYFMGRRKICRPLAMAEDPWGNRSHSDKNEQPPDLDEFFSNLIRHKKKSGGNEPSNDERPPLGNMPDKKIIALASFLAALIWCASGIYTVNERENGVEIFLGKFTTTTASGLNWHWPAPIGTVEKVDVQSISTMRVGEFQTRKGSVSTHNQREGQMLTKDENIVEIGAAVQYRINDAKAFLYQAKDPIEVLRDVVTSAIREVVGANTVDEVLKDRRNDWPQESRQIIERTLKDYDIGIEIVAFELQDARAPAEVQDAFEDAVRAREDEERLRLEAEAYRNERVPVARGEAEQHIQRAFAYAVSVEEQAKAQASKFNALLAAYRQDKTAMRDRLYLDSVARVYTQTQKILVDNDNARPIINLPTPVASETVVSPQTISAVEEPRAVVEKPKDNKTDKTLTTVPVRTMNGRERPSRTGE